MLKFPESFPVLRKGNIILRKIKNADQIAIYQGLSDAQVIRYYGVEYHSYADTGAQMHWYKDLWLTQTGIWWAITTEDIGDLIGACGFYNLQSAHRKAELGYWLMPHYWNQGIMRLALEQILTYGLEELNLHRLEAYVETENQASAHLLQQLGFRHEGTLQDCEIKKQRFISLDIFALLNPEEKLVSPATLG